MKLRPEMGQTLFLIHSKIIRKIFTLELFGNIGATNNGFKKYQNLGSTNFIRNNITISNANILIYHILCLNYNFPLDQVHRNLPQVKLYFSDHHTDLRYL